MTLFFANGLISHPKLRTFMTQTILSFDQLNDLLRSADSMTETPEAHGTLCGIICLSGKTGLGNWLSLLFEELDSDNSRLQESQRILKQHYEMTLEVLASPNYDLNILVHSDDTALDIRVGDLSLWCQGFLYGLSIAGLTDLKSLPVDAQEILQDMSDISKVGYSQEDDDNESNEAAFAEIIEYMRVGAYIVFNTFNGNNSIPDSKTVH